MVNFRDLAYLNIKKGLLFRSAALRNLSNEDIEFIKKSNIKLIIDLRGKEEAESTPDTAIEGVRNINLPIVGDTEDTKFELRPINVKGIDLPDLAYYYQQFVWPKVKGFWSQLFVILLSIDGGVLFHCTEGKDRSGAVIAIIINILKVSLRIKIRVLPRITQAKETFRYGLKI